MKDAARKLAPCVSRGLTTWLVGLGWLTVGLSGCGVLDDIAEAERVSNEPSPCTVRPHEAEQVWHRREGGVACAHQARNETVLERSRELALCGPIADRASLEASFTVVPDGRTQAIHVARPYESACVMRLIERWSFPEADTYTSYRIEYELPPATASRRGAE